MASHHPAVFLDRDGVIIRDTAPVSAAASIEILPGVPDALRRLAGSGRKLVVITNQAIVARGVLTEPELLELQREIERRLANAGAPPFDAFRYCPHHPNATLANYRLECACRKPRPGLLLKVAAELNLELARSFMIGDRMTDIEAGHRAGCRTILVHSGAHHESRIVTSDPAMPGLAPDHTCGNLAEAATFILGESR